MRRLVCVCVVRKPPRTGFLASRPQILLAVPILLDHVQITGRHPRKYITAEQRRIDIDAIDVDTTLFACYVSTGIRDKETSLLVILIHCPFLHIGSILIFCY